MSAMYFWDGEAVITIARCMGSSGVRDSGLNDHLCVDTSYILPERRYGTFGYVSGWEPISLVKFPKKFRTHLLLLGVS